LKDSRGEDIDHDFTERTTFVIRKDQTIAATFSSADDKITPAQHVEKSLEAVQQLTGK
jgi:peroxiredoxin